MEFLRSTKTKVASLIMMEYFLSTSEVILNKVWFYEADGLPGKSKVYKANESGTKI